MHTPRLTTALAATALAATSLVAWAPAQEDAETTAEEACWTHDRGTPDDDADDLDLCRLDTWIHRADTPAGNVEGVVAEQFPTWDTDAPDTSVTGGAGGGYLSNSVADQFMPGDPNNAATFNGTYTGTLENMAVTMYAWIPGRQAEGSNHNAHIMLDVDGFTVYDQGDVEVMTTPDGDSVVRIDFVLTELAGTLDLFGLANDADTEHDISLRLASWNYGFDEAIYIYDTTEVPSGIVFNLQPENLDGFTTLPVA